MKIIDNFIDDKSFKKLSEAMFGVEFPWYYNSSKSSIDDDENYQFTHIFFSEKTIKTSHWKLVLPIIEKLEVKDLIRVKANLTTQTKKPYQADYHEDLDIFTEAGLSYKTAIYYHLAVYLKR